jgi:cyclophilin family peptidyl-prolyl cis-trans isomerase
MSKSSIIHIGLILVLVLIIILGARDVNKKTQVQTQIQEEEVIAQAIEGLEVKEETQIMETEQETLRAVMNTSKGVITLLLMKENAPKTVENFVTLAQNGFYDGTRFHRVIEGFMIQGGDPLSKDTAQMSRWGTGGPGYQFADEIHAENHNMKGTISMANAGPNTNGSQFFINVADNVFLDTKHTVFGKVVEGYDIVETIALVDTVPGVDRPVEDVIIESIEIK